MSGIKKGNSFIQSVDKFFKRVQNQDLITLGGKGKINILNSPQSKEELKLKQQMQVFRQYLQNKNWNLKHIEFFDEYRRMDSTFPIISAALDLYSQEVCVTGDCIVSTPMGDKTIRELYDEKKNLFFIDSLHPHFTISINAECKGIKNNGIKDVWEVTVVRNIDEETAAWDKKQEAKFKCTDNHQIMIGDKSFKQLKDLKIGDTIFAKYISIDPSCSCKKHRFVNTIITDIKYAGKEEVFDLLDVGPHHNFSIKLTDSFYIYVHNCNKDADGDIFKIISDDKEVKRSLNECFYDNLKLDSKSYLYVRSMLKFGNLFGFLETRRGVGVTDIITLPPESIRIMLLQQADRLDQFNYIWNGYGGGIEFDPWEIVHWKVIKDIEHEPYGQSVLRSIVDTWRRIVLMREALIIYRITRAPQRFLFKIDTTGMDGDAALRFAEQMKKQLMKKPLVNPITGEIDAKFSTASVLEDFYMPTTEGDVGDIRILEGATNLDQVEDYKIIKDDIFAGLLIPKSYLTFEEDLCLRSSEVVLTNEGKLTMKEIAERFELSPDKKLFSLSCTDFGLITQGKITWCKPTKEVNFLYRVHLSNGRYNDVTDNHPYLLDSLVYKRADELQKGDLIRNIFEKEISVKKIEIIELESPEYVYDLEVENYHNFALESGIFVHNSNKAALCIHGDTEIPLLDGRNIKVKDLANESKENWVYTYDEKDNKIIPGKVKWCKQTRKNADVVKVTLDNGKFIISTHDHEFLRKGGELVEAKDLKPGDSLQAGHTNNLIVGSFNSIKAVSVEFLEEKFDTYDLEVDDENHNFLTTAGVFIKNSQEDLRFNNAVKQYQSYYIDGMMHTALVHLYMNGYSKDELESFEIQMNGSSTLAEKAKNELLQQRIDLANSALTQTIDGISLYSFTQVLRDVLKFTDEEIAETFRNQMVENKLIWQLKQLRDEGYYEDPDPNKKKARLKGMVDELDVFKDLQFEAAEQLPKVGEILSRKLDKELKGLTGGNKKKPSKQLIESVVDLQDSKIGRNIKKTYTDLGMKPNETE